MGVAMADNPRPGKCYLSHICVNESARGKGIGNLLLERAEYEARARNCSVSIRPIFCVVRLLKQFYTKRFYTSYIGSSMYIR